VILTTYNIDWGIQKYPSTRSVHFLFRVHGKCLMTEVTRVHRMEELDRGTRLVFNDGSVTRYMDVDESFDQCHQWFEKAGLFH
jgi:hypothetical protein